MKFKSHNFAKKKFAPLILVVFFILAFMTKAHGQPENSGYSDVARQRLLIRIIAQYMHTISQGQIDMDSAIRIPCRLYGLSPLLAYNEGYSDGRPSAGSRLLDAGKLNDARSLLGRSHGQPRLRLLIEIGSYLIFKPGTRKADLDEASRYIQEALVQSHGGPVRWTIECMTLQAHLKRQSGDILQSQKILGEAVTLAERSGDTVTAARTLLNAAELLPYGDSLRRSYFVKALAIYMAKRMKEKQIEALSDINIDYFVLKRYDLAEQFLIRVVQLQSEINFRHQQYAYDGLAYLANRKGDLKSALAYSNKSCEHLVTPADSTFKGFFFSRRAILYQRLEKYGESIAFFDKSLENKTAETRLYWYKAFLGKANSLDLMGREREALSLLLVTGSRFPPNNDFEKMHYAFLLGMTYDYLKKYRQAEDNYKIFLAMAEKFPPEYIHDEIPAAFFQISTFYRIIGKTALARELLERGKAVTPKLDLERSWRYYYNLYKIDSAEKRYLEAINDLRLSQNFSDSAFNYESIKNTRELLAKYEADKKDRNIKLLNSQNQLQQITVLEANKTKNITLAGVALLLIISGLLFQLYRTKLKNNRSLQAQQRELDQKNIFLETLNSDQEKLLKEKEWLIKEVHHRVKNNLQMVTSLLYSQSVYLEDGAAVLAIKDSLRRMQAMSLIHQKLYQDKNTSTIAMPEYINDLVRYLHESFDADNRIVFEQAIEPVELEVAQAVPLGLIFTESIVNAIKYAFLNGQQGVVRISLGYDGPGHLLLKISDNGIGLPAGLDTMEHNSLGLDLMQGLSKQLKGTFQIENNNGVHITVRFAV